MSFGQWLFGFSGRIGRGRFWGGIGMSILFAIVMMVLIGVFGDIQINAQGEIVSISPIGIALYIVTLILGVWISFALYVKRCHDRGKSGWWSLLSLVPIVGILWVLIDLGILEGQNGPNQYGPDPRAPAYPPYQQAAYGQNPPPPYGQNFPPR
jgi:uncharacterized membrane protein YhaH (DUF805 family)